MALDRNHSEDLRRIANAPPEKLKVVVDRLSQLTPDPISRRRLHVAAREAMANDKDTADSFIRQALVQFWPIRRHGVSVQDVLEYLRATINTEPEWNPQDQENWSKIESVFGELLSLDNVRLVASALDLSYEQVNVFEGARILTDIRPIFDNDLERIDGAVIAHALHIQFQNVQGTQEVAIALDHADVEVLLDICERALKKAELAHSFMKEAGNKPTMTPEGAADE